MNMNIFDPLKGRKVTVFDTTLRDGEQTPGVSLTPQQKLEIAGRLDRLGVNIIEAGFPISSESDLEAVKLIVNENFNAEICGLARAELKDIDACLDSGVQLIHVFIPTSPIQRQYTIKKSEEEVVDLAIKAVEYVKDHGARCMFSAMDATRTDWEYLLRIYQKVVDAGCDIINVPDTVGYAHPYEMYGLIKYLSENITGVPIDVHCHNDLGMALANTLEAVRAGATQIQVTMNGIGERAGNADLSHVAMNLMAKYKMLTDIKPEFLYQTSELVQRLTGIWLPPNYPIVGLNAFSHESGIHSQGVLQESKTFEVAIVTPEMVGHKRRIVLGKHMGKSNVADCLAKAGITFNTAQLAEITQRLKEIAGKGKAITDIDLYTVAAIVIGKAEMEEMLQLKEVSVMTGNLLTPTATIKAAFQGKEVLVAETGLGPVDAALNAVRGILGENNGFKLQEFRIEAIAGGSDALADVYIGLEDENGLIASARAADPDIVMASVKALVYAINLLYYKNRKTNKNYR